MMPRQSSEKLLSLCLLGASALIATAAVAQNVSIPAHIQAAVASDERNDEMRARDAGRMPGAVLALSGIEPGDHVVEFGSFGLYYTTMLAAAVGPDGMVEMIDPPRADGFGGDASRAFDAAHDNAAYHVVDYNEVELPDGIDAAFCVLFYHDLMPWGFDTAALNAKVFDALKPGGVFVVVDHKAEDGSGWRDAGTIHRIGKETIIEELTSAGFELAVDSDLLAHPEDDRTQGVFTMRGETDRVLLVFRKPG
jgi:predicted methyltransferase